ncbi:MEMO-like protein [Syntrophotalea carbinolica DSM 2380]|uniref:MEMO1 family protein Pcar_1651 n=1 Tax=Syntrophotalea carbinolica (strain DSM 2380 / NBRC 103641 / GraBd1) TaxID=338963 RepID=Q3A412_SYNC1|nr:AmmeMemoRadiSam system protein B [Syntrophotalea carbinolica]ABA88895.1 MEMO-like protein [Syntrophotalea carbinolica DSM 2380]
MRRMPAVAGQFYPADPKSLRSMVETYLEKATQSHPAIGLMVPHAGYVFSGAIAGQTFGCVDIPSKVLVIGPNHTGYGESLALFAKGSWVTPLGEVPIAEGLADRVLQAHPRLMADDLAHRFEHSLEVQIPFLQVRAPDVQIVPLCLAPVPYEELLALGNAIGQVLAAEKEPVLLVASSDMTHYEPGAAARKKDHMALKHVCDLDPEGLYRTVASENISMCGVVSTVVMLAAAQCLGAQKGRLVCYGNSGEVTGDQSEVVGYAGVVVE